MSKVLTENVKRTAQRKSLIDLIWSEMSLNKCYSIRDLANISGATGQSVADVMYFLSKYGFVKQLGEVDSVYTRFDCRLSPNESVALLEMMISA